MEFRNYTKTDYADCESLVSEAWQFDTHFQPQALTDIAKHIYTMGPVMGSNYRKVVEEKGRVVGFIFGFNNREKKPRGAIRFGIKIMWRLLFSKDISKEKRKRILNAFNTHELNRRKLVGKGKSEIALFVVNPEYQGKGIGKELLKGFLDNCRRSNIESVIVEANKLGASSFYERVGFKHIGNFDSPLHAYTTEGKACMYEYML